ncbi:aldo/keto reductase family protein [Mycoplasmoides fastidiosum]|uniref:aldo/keto reductase family protein n=1 Tax=Mycoplasmoides fastidiosum TaxID=92758 RepID=UPI002113DBDD|nr:aldo/keto reductase [Mycoplasmoides fastidiosum]UUD37360.1 aldo/keto reductase [Mycoplasmoides fastidiosum]
MSELIKNAQNAGFDFIDCAWRYGNEAAIGIAIKKIETKYKRFSLKMELQSKIWPSQYKGGINKSLKTSLQKLGNIQEIDSYLLHRPHCDTKMTISAWKQLVDCKRIRNVKVIGVSNFDKDLILKLYEITNYLPEFNRIELSVNNMRWDRINFCKSKNIAIQAYAPLGDIESNLTDKRIIKIAEKYDATVPQILLAYLMYFDISPIICAHNKKEIDEYAKAKEIDLNAKDIEELNKINTYHNTCPETEEIDFDEIDREQNNVFNKIKAGAQKRNTNL